MSTVSENIKDKLSNLPSTPGVYQFKDKAGKVLYVGKAKVLKNRVRQYFQNRPVTSTRLDILVSKTEDIELIQTDNEVEALILELNLIKELKPRYNINLKDDKSFPYIVITKEPFPRVFPTRKKRSDGSKYFGPYTDVKNMRSALKSIRDIFQIRSCKLNLTEESIAAGKFKVCLDYHIKKCEGPCEGLQTKEEYNRMISQVAKMLNGKTTSLIKEMNFQMNEHSANLEFEKAAKLRDKIEALEVYSSKQKMVDEEMTDRDVIAIEREDNDAVGMVLKIRDGKVIGKSHTYINNVLEKEDDEIIENFVTNYYLKAEYIPEQIYLEKEIENADTLKKWLEMKREDKIEIVIPKIGEKAKLVNMVKANAKFVLNELKIQKLKKEFIPHSLEALKRDLRLTKLPRRIECYDISHIQGTDTVASMVVFIDAKPKKSDYRKFKLMNILNEVGKPDDFLSMREVIHRRFRRIDENEENKSDNSFSSVPDLIVIDGGKGQLSSAVKVLTDIGLEKLNVIGLAKRLEEVYLPGASDPQSIPHTSSGLKLLQRIRDEAHRFAITFHRNLRNKRTISSELENIKGIGKVKATNLLKEFGSVSEIERLLKEDYEFIEKKAGKKTTEILKTYFSENNNNENEI
ncbi:MAG TPA: excinuclease ABC subunit UvrC [Ignavibacteria bacterium]|nr:excinuclease ABC subunit UvrC [Ignavibacteria bacterium]